MEGWVYVNDKFFSFHEAVCGSQFRKYRGLERRKSTPSIARLSDMTGDLWSLLLNPSHRPPCGGMSLQLRVSAPVSVDLSQGLWQLCLVWEAGAEVRYEEKRGFVF